MDKFEFYVYTNNNNLRHILSQNEIMSKDFFETDKYYESFSTLIDWGILLTDKKCSSSFLNNFKDDYQNLYPVVLKVNLNHLLNQNAYLIKNDYTTFFNKIGNYDSSKHFGLIIPVFLPAFVIETICFNSEEEKKRYTSLLMRNIFLESYDYEVNSDLFNGDYAFDIQKLKCIEGKNFSEPQDKIKNFIQLRRKIRAGIIAAFGNFKYNVTNELFLNFDKLFLSLFEFLIPNYNSSEDWNKIKKQFLEKPLTNAQALWDDNTLFPAILKNLFESNSSSPFLSSSNMVEKDRILDEKISLFLVETFIKGKELERDNFRNFLDSLENNLCETENGFHKIRSYIDTIFKIKHSEISIRDAVLTLNNAFMSLKSLIFLMSMNPQDTLNDILYKLEQYKTNPFFKRLTLFYYGLMKGLSPLDADFKKNQTVLVLSDFLSLKKYYPEFFQSLSIEYVKECLLRANRKDLKFVENNFVESTLGLKLIYFKIDFKEKFRKILLSLLNSKGKEILQKYIPECIEKAKIYCSPEISFSQENLNSLVFENNKWYITLKSDQNLNIKFKFLESGWTKFVEKYLKNEKEFRKIPPEQLIELYKYLEKAKLVNSYELRIDH